MFPEAMPVLQQQQPLRRQGADRHAIPRRQPVAIRQSREEGVGGERQRLRLPAGAGQRQQQQVQPAGFELRHEALRLILPQPEAQAREATPQRRHQPRQQEGADGRDDAEAQRAGKRVARGGGGFRHSLQRRQRLPGPRHHLQPEGGEDQGYRI